MTNQGKAREYTATKIKANPDAARWNTTTTYMSACEWKDQQFKEYLEKKKAALHFRSDWIGYHSAICTELIDEIISELFGED